MPDATATPQVDNHTLAEQVYDMIMGSIEPDLLLKNIPLLDAQYASETKEEHEARMQRYAVAYEKFDAELQQFMDKVNTNVRTAQRQSLKEREEQERQRDQEKLSSLASAFG
jgi:hypothetical protein